MTSKKACIYTRVSTSEQAAEGYSIAEQERMCKACIESKGWEYVATFSDPGVSGRTMDRPGLQAMLKLLSEGGAEAVVIYKLDRLSRKQRHTMTLIEDVFLANEVDLVSLNETLDTSTPWGRAMIGILSSFNQMESENIQERTSMGRKAKAAKGGYIGGKPPLGYKAVEGQLEVVPEEAEVVRKIFHMRDRRKWAYQPIADALNKEGYKTKKGNQWYASTVREVISHRKLYNGEYSYGDLAIKGLCDRIL